MAMAGRKRILVLQTQFSEFGESAAAFKACQRLARDGHEVLTTTTTTIKDDLAKEKEVAKNLGRRGGSVKLITPECDSYEDSKTDWITTRLYKAYFSSLASLENVDMVVTLMPGTTKTGVDLVKELRRYGKVQLILLACTKIGGDQTELHSEIEEIIQSADEIWSIGPDLFTHYNELFAGYNKGLQKIKHKELIFMPSKTYTPGLQRFWKSFFSTGSLNRVVSLWQEGTPYQYKGNLVKGKSSGSSLQDYCCLCKALGKISSELSYRKQKIEWDILGPEDILKSMVPSIKSNQSKGKHTFPINGLTLPTSAETFCTKRLRKSTMFIAPEKTEDTFNFAAYEAIKFGIPTLVSSDSSLGKILSQLHCPVAPRAIVELTGDQQHDVEQWKKAIYEHILSDPAEARGWARELSKFLADSPEIQSYEEDVFGPKGGVSGYRGSSLDVEDTASSGTTISDGSPRLPHNGRLESDGTPTGRPTSVSTYSPHSPLDDPETRARASSFGTATMQRFKRPFRPKRLHDDTQDLTQLDQAPSTVAGAKSFLRQMSGNLTNRNRQIVPANESDATTRVEPIHGQHSRIKHETIHPYSPIPEDAAKTFSVTLRERHRSGGPRLPRPRSDPFEEHGSPRVPKPYSSPFAQRMEVVGPRTVERHLITPPHSTPQHATPPHTPPLQEIGKERSRSLSGGRLFTAPVALIDPSMVCTLHHKFFEFYCEETLTPLCSDCTGEPYNSMKNIVSLTEVETKLKVSMNSSHRQTHIQLKELFERRECLKQAAVNLQNQATVAIRRINQRREFTYELLESIANSMIEHVRSASQEERRKIEDELLHTEENLRQLKKQHATSHTVLEAKPSIEFIKQAKVVLAEDENNQIQSYPNPIQAVHSLEFQPALISITDPSRAQVLIEDCLLGHLQRRSEEVYLPSDSMLNIFDTSAGRAAYYSPDHIDSSHYGTRLHDESLSSISSFRSLQIGDRMNGEFSPDAAVTEELQYKKSKSDSDLTQEMKEPDLKQEAKESKSQESALEPVEMTTFSADKLKEKQLLPPATASFISAIPISSIKPALEHILDICRSSDGIWISGHYTPERWKTPHLCICKLDGSTKKVELVYDVDAKDAGRSSVLLESNGRLIYAKRKDWRIFEINPKDPKQKPTVTYSMVTQRVGALTGAGKYMFFSDVTPENQGCMQMLKWKESDLRYKRTVHTSINTESHENIHLGLVCSPTSPVPWSDDAEPEVCMLIVSDSGDNKNVIAVDTDGYVHWQLAGHSSDLLKEGFDPAGVCSDYKCNVYIADKAHNRVLVVTPNGKNIHCLLNKDNGIQDPSKLCLAMDGQQLAVLNKKGQEIALYDIDIR